MMLKIKSILLLLLAAASFFISNAQSACTDSLLQFVLQHKAHAAVYITKNDSVIAALHPDVLMPLGSTAHLLTAIEFAKQAGNAVISEEQYVPIKETDKYYIEGTDNNAHNQWKAAAHGLIKNDSIQLYQIAKGMLQHHSAANAEYLLDLLGLDNVKTNITLFNLKRHTAVFPLPASLFLYQNPNRAKESKIIKSIQSLTEEGYCKSIYQIHNALKYDTVLKHKFLPAAFTPSMQQLWTERLTASTAREYVHVVRILNTRKFLNANSYGILAEIAEDDMSNASIKKKYAHLAAVNGNNPGIYTEVFYATLLNGDRIEAAFFFNQLSEKENERLQRWVPAVSMELEQQTVRTKINSLLNEK